MYVDSDAEALKFANYMIDYNWSIRYIADNCMISKSKVHSYLTKRLKDVDIEKYYLCQDIMQKHRKESRRDRTGKFIKQY